MFPDWITGRWGRYVSSVLYDEAEAYGAVRHIMQESCKKVATDQFVMGARLADQFRKDRVLKMTVFNIKVFAYRYPPCVHNIIRGLLARRGEGVSSAVTQCKAGLG